MIKPLRFCKTAIQKQPIRQRSTVISVGGNVLDKNKNCEWDDAIPYKDIPGPKPLPLLGNTWRFMPVLGKLLN